MLAQCASRLPLRVYVDDVETTCSRADANLEQGDVRLHYRVARDRSAAARVRVEILPVLSAGHIQAAFVQNDKHIILVNAKDPRDKLEFDGFPSEDDESQTTPFVLALLKSALPREHLDVRTKAKLMTDSNNLKIFINEAVLLRPSKWYYNLLFFNPKQNDTDDENAHEKELSFKLERERRALPNLNYSRQTNSVVNSTRWAPVDCRTGRSLLDAELLFHFE
ncbi:ORF128 [Lymantria xylina nucleopolyhedrovirus]|uniref:ORF128 n=1 Tax=Lymantria xylina multiple nucleopolyhedrovirus TaxID=2847840 RepID=D4N2G5_9ABAC|nr:ORF128 [Lymantria xylina nucleopolyhedrovirus]ADD73837.1 ORF128 [Lymantria xylina nucleopolyhedrovirus]